MVNTHGKRRSTPPSRRRYEASHPTVSFRVDLDLYAQLKGLKEKANSSVADVLKVGYWSRGFPAKSGLSSEHTRS
jgi:hypothetical protein